MTGRTRAPAGARASFPALISFFRLRFWLSVVVWCSHLDFPSVLWLENRLRGYGKSFLVVSHDRELLNNVTTGTILIEDKQLKYYNCGFKEFEKQKANEDKKKEEEI